MAEKHQGVSEFIRIIIITSEFSFNSLAHDGETAQQKTSRTSFVQNLFKKGTEPVWS